MRQYFADDPDVSGSDAKKAQRDINRYTALLERSTREEAERLGLKMKNGLVVMPPGDDR